MGWFAQIQEGISQAGGVQRYATVLIRWLLPVLAVIVIARCILSLLSEKSEAETWGWLSLPNGARINLNHWENVIGRAKTSDVYMEYPSLSRNHAALVRDDKGNWRIYNVASKSGIVINGKDADIRINDKTGAPVKTGDVICLGGVDLIFVAADGKSEYEQAAARTRPGKIYKQRTTLIFLTEFQLLLGLQLCISKGDRLTAGLPLCFLALILLMWLCYLFTRIIRRVSFEVETIAFFLCSIGMAVVATGAPAELPRHILLLLMGVCLFFTLGWFLRDLGRAKKMRPPIAVFGILLLLANLILGKSVYGARNWLIIGGISFQPAELVKIAFILAGAATLERLFARRNLIVFIGITGVCLIVLALINDFGMAMVFFVSYLVIAYLRSGDFATIFLSVGGAGFAGFLALRFRSHIAARFASWGRAWEFANTSGYQQTRAMAAAATGGLIGVGAGNGWLKHIFAADTDLVFALVSEEMGLIIALAAISSILALAVFSIRSAGTSRSSFYVIGACAASVMLVFQMLLNVLGSVDILPFTGVTFPFVSKGGSSLISCWCLLAFIKATDTRQNASFVVRTPKKPVGADNSCAGKAGDDIE